MTIIDGNCYIHLRRIKIRGGNMNKLKIFMCCRMILATVLGIYGQGISYYIGTNIISVSPVILLSIITFISITLFISTPILNKVSNNQVNMNRHLTPYITVNNIIGIPVSIYSLFVLIMWWG